MRGGVWADTWTVWGSGGPAESCGGVDASRAFSFPRTYSPVCMSRWIRQTRLVEVYCGSISVVCSASGCALSIICNRPAGGSHACYTSLNTNIKGTLDRGAATICSRAARQRWPVPGFFPACSTHRWEFWRRYLMHELLLTLPYVRCISTYRSCRFLRHRRHAHDSSRLCFYSHYMPIHWVYK